MGLSILSNSNASKTNKKKKNSNFFRRGEKLGPSLIRDEAADETRQQMKTKEKNK